MELKNKTPGELAELRLGMADDYGKLGRLLMDVKKEKAKAWLDIRKTEGVKSDAMANRIWESTEMGIKEMEIKLKMKIKEKKISAIKTALDVANMEAYNQY